MFMFFRDEKNDLVFGMNSSNIKSVTPVFIECPEEDGKYGSRIDFCEPLSMEHESFDGGFGAISRMESDMPVEDFLSTLKESEMHFVISCSS